jgi:hypothetical protein
MCSRLRAIAHKRGTLCIHDGLAAEQLAARAKQRLDDPHERKHRKAQRGPVDELARGLVGEDRPEGPGDGDGRREVALGAGEGVGGGGTLEEEESEEDKDLGPDAGVVLVGVDAEGLEGGEDDEDGGPPCIRKRVSV